jgi:mono/diheme cytochrome c family protein
MPDEIFFLSLKMWYKTGILLVAVFLFSCNNASQQGETQFSNEEDLLVYGKKLFESECAICHGVNTSFAGAKDLTKSTLDINQTADIIYHGRKTMPAFKDKLGEPEILAISKYVQTLKKK